MVRLDRLRRIPGSFRDPSGYVFEDETGSVFRTVTQNARDAFDYVEGRGIIAELERAGLIVTSTRTSFQNLSNETQNIAYLLSHQRIPFVSYPYEWTFEQLRDAALLHLEIQLRSLEKNVTLSDATSYNIQFIGARSVFVDRLSFVPYVEGSYWLAHRQFVEQFVAPLLLWAYGGVPFNEYYRGSVNGISLDVLERLIPIRRKLSLRYAIHVMLPVFFQQRTRISGNDENPASNHPFPKDSFFSILRQLQNWIAKLTPPRPETFWRRYGEFRCYSDADVKERREFVRSCLNDAAPGRVWDIGCNTGEMCFLSLDAGVREVIGFDKDHGALTAAYQSAKKAKASFLPLYMDLCAPSPSLGWNQSERLGLLERRSADFAVSLAVLHHIAIGNNVPLPSALDFLIGIAPAGVVEWVPKSDPMIRSMLATRQDIFSDYEQDTFTRLVRERADILRIKKLTSSKRTLFFYRRRNDFKVALSCPKNFFSK